MHLADAFIQSDLQLHSSYFNYLYMFVCVCVYIYIYIYIYVPVAQWLEHCVSSAKVVGSIPWEHMY